MCISNYATLSSGGILFCSTAKRSLAWQFWSAQNRFCITLILCDKQFLHLKLPGWEAMFFRLPSTPSSGIFVLFYGQAELGLAVLKCAKLLLHNINFCVISSFCIWNCQAGRRCVSASQAPRLAGFLFFYVRIELMSVFADLGNQEVSIPSSGIFVFLPGTCQNGSLNLYGFQSRLAGFLFFYCNMWGVRQRDAHIIPHRLQLSRQYCHILPFSLSI